MRKPGSRCRRKLNNSQGYTLVEMVVCFALLGIFLAAAFQAIASAMNVYYHVRGTQAAYTVADTVLSEIRNDIQTMQPTNSTDDKYDGYVLVRKNKKDAEGNDIREIVSEEDGSYTGDCLEFVSARGAKIVNIKEEDSDTPKFADSNYIEQIDTAGFQGKIYNENKNDVKSGVETDQNILTVRYYARSNEDATEGLGIDQPGVGDSSFQRARGVEERLGKRYYNNQFVRLQFEVTPKKVDSKDSTADKSADGRVSYVRVTVNVYRNASDLAADKKLYSKEDYITLENTVKYETAKTMYSDMTSTGESGGS